MKSFSFSSIDRCGVSAQEIAGVQQRLAPEIERVAAAWDGPYDSSYASLHLSSDRALQERVLDLSKRKKQLKPSLMIVIGIGGSNLGAKAVWQAMAGFFYNYDAGMPVHFADSVDSSFTRGLYEQAQGILQKGEQLLLVVISKSGTTTETIANAQLFTGLLKAHRTNYQEYLVVITDEGSPLWKVAQEHSMDALAIPKEVGGRYSVLSAAGLFPLAMLDIDIIAFCKGAHSVKAITQTAENNHAALAAAILYLQYHKGLHIHDMFFFIERLESLGMWMRQLIAESLGKAIDNDGAPVHVGITPTVSIGTVDLHSVAQLYLAGPNDRFTVFITAAAQEDRLSVPSGTPFDLLVPMIEGKSYGQIMAGIVDGVKAAYSVQNRPFVSLEFDEITPYSIGQFMQLAMIEIIYLGYLFNIDPFNQPQVELYKQETRKILSHE